MQGSRLVKYRHSWLNTGASSWSWSNKKICVSIYSFYISFSEDFTTQTCTPILEVPFIFMLEAIHFTVHACFSVPFSIFWFNRACVEKMGNVMETMCASEVGMLFVLGGLS